MKRAVLRESSRIRGPLGRRRGRRGRVGIFATPPLSLATADWRTARRFRSNYPGGLSRVHASVDVVSMRMKRAV